MGWFMLCFFGVFFVVDFLYCFFMRSAFGLFSLFIGFLTRLIFVKILPVGFFCLDVGCE